MKRTLVLGAAWTASAAAAVGLGFLAVSLVDASASPAAAVARRATATATPAPPPLRRRPPRPGSWPPRRHGLRLLRRRRCPSWRARRPPAGGSTTPATPGKVEFRNGTQKVEVRVACVDGAPQFSVEGPRADDSGGGGDAPVRHAVSASAARRRRPRRRRLRPVAAAAATGRRSGRATTVGSGSRRGGGHGSDGLSGATSGGRRDRQTGVRPAWETSPVLLRMSTLFLRTLRDDPADAEVPSHRLLVRAGYIRRAAPGGFTWLPLGFRVFRNVERVVREEMDAMGAQEVHFPALLPREPYEATGRWTEYGPNLFRLQDRRGQRLPARPHPRGDVHAPGEGPVRVLQGPAALAVPDPDQVPGRGAAPGRADSAAASSR